MDTISEQMWPAISRPSLELFAFDTRHEADKTWRFVIAP